MKLCDDTGYDARIAHLGLSHDEQTLVVQHRLDDLALSAAYADNERLEAAIAVVIQHFGGYPPDPDPPPAEED